MSVVFPILHISFMAILPATGLENIVIFSLISKYREYHKYHDIFDIYRIFSIFLIFSNVRIVLRIDSVPVDNFALSKCTARYSGVVGYTNCICLNV